MTSTAVSRYEVGKVGKVGTSTLSNCKQDASFRRFLLLVAQARQGSLLRAARLFVVDFDWLREPQQFVIFRSLYKSIPVLTVLIVDRHPCLFNVGPTNSALCLTTYLSRFLL